MRLDDQSISSGMHLRHDFVHLGGGESPASRRVDVAHRSEMQDGSGRRFIVRGFQDQKAVVVAQGPVDVLDLRTELLRLSLEDRRPLGRVVDVFDALLRELDFGDESCHVDAPVVRDRLSEQLRFYREQHWAGRTESSRGLKPEIGDRLFLDNAMLELLSFGTYRAEHDAAKNYQ